MLVSSGAGSHEPRYCTDTVAGLDGTALLDVLSMRAVSGVVLGSSRDLFRSQAPASAREPSKTTGANDSFDMSWMLRRSCQSAVRLAASLRRNRPSLEPTFGRAKNGPLVLPVE